MKKWKVKFSGYAYVEANDEESAEEAFQDDREVYKETVCDDVSEVDEFIVEL